VEISFPFKGKVGMGMGLGHEQTHPHLSPPLEGEEVLANSVTPHPSRMTPRKFRILNVFSLEGKAFSGNPLCVVEDGQGLRDDEMQAIALQFNLSETTFIVPSNSATARIRIFTPDFELPFAGHPILGSAHVVRDLLSTGDSITLETKSGVTSVSAQGNAWELTASPPTTRPLEVSIERLAAMLGLSASDIGAPAMWVNTGVEQLLVPLHSVDALKRCQPTIALLDRATRNERGVMVIYLWASDDAGNMTVRLFFEKANGLCEDPGTGSACANLGGWLLLQNTELPREINIDQGEQTGRKCRLTLRLDSAKNIKVSGNVTEFGRGEIFL
jgi:trans-2,3-dihydro-3-hydroxyanthranilate isomerase